MKASKRKVLFLDETFLKVSEKRRRTLVAPGEKPFIVVEDTSAYAPRYDMIACCSSERVFPPIIYTPGDRKQLGVKGIREFMLLSYIDKILGQAVASLDLYPLTLVLDRSTTHNPGKIMEAFHDAGCQDLATVYLLPPNSAKRMSPLDNSLFHKWKEGCRKRKKLTSKNIVQIMADEWNKITKKTLHAQYQHCGLMCGKEVYFDCPAPTDHNHHLH